MTSQGRRGLAAEVRTSEVSNESNLIRDIGTPLLSSRSIVPRTISGEPAMLTSWGLDRRAPSRLDDGPRDDAVRGDPGGLDLRGPGLPGVALDRAEQRPPERLEQWAALDVHVRRAVPDGVHLLLHRCPFREVAERRADVVWGCTSR